MGPGRILKVQKQKTVISTVLVYKIMSGINRSDNIHIHSKPNLIFMSKHTLSTWISETEAACLVEFAPEFFRRAVTKGSLKKVITYERLNSNTYSYNKIDIENYMYETKYANL